MLCKFIPIVNTKEGRRESKSYFYKAVCLSNDLRINHYFSINAIYKYIYEFFGEKMNKDNVRIYSDERAHCIKCEHFIGGYWQLIFKIHVLSKDSVLHDI
jgi:hypothetical protein